MATTHPATSPDSIEAQAPLAEWELAMIEMFVHASQLIGIPKSMGQIYGLLFCLDRPLPMDEIIQYLGISKGSVSQGLRTLRRLGAVKQVFQVGDRRDHYAAEDRLRKLVAGFLGDQIKPHLQSGSSRLNHLQELAGQEGPESLTRAHQRVRILQAWHSKAETFLPVVQKFL